MIVKFIIFQRDISFWDLFWHHAKLSVYMKYENATVFFPSDCNAYVMPIPLVRFENCMLNETYIPVSLCLTQILRVVGYWAKVNLLSRFLGTIPCSSQVVCHDPSALKCGFAYFVRISHVTS